MDATLPVVRTPRNGALSSLWRNRDAGTPKSRASFTEKLAPFNSGGIAESLDMSRGCRVLPRHQDASLNSGEKAVETPVVAETPDGARTNWSFDEGFEQATSAAQQDPVPAESRAGRIPCRGRTPCQKSNTGHATQRREESREQESERARSRGARAASRRAATPWRPSPASTGTPAASAVSRSPRGHERPLPAAAAPGGQ